jgi:hypothetical protein
MQQFIIINNSTCFGHLYAHLQEYTPNTPEDGHIDAETCIYNNK